MQSTPQFPPVSALGETSGETSIAGVAAGILRFVPVRSGRAITGFLGPRVIGRLRLSLKENGK